MFRASICPSSGVQVVYCYMWCSALYNAEHHMQQYTTCTPEDGHIDVRNM